MKALLENEATLDRELAQILETAHAESEKVLQHPNRAPLNTIPSTVSAWPWNTAQAPAYTSDHSPIGK